MVWYSHLFQNFPQFIVIHTVKGFGIVNKSEIDVFLKLSCFYNDPTNKARGGDGSPAEPFQSLKEDAVKVLHSICQQVWETQQWPRDWKRSVFIPIPNKGNAKECSNYPIVALISPASKVTLKILQARLQRYVNHKLPDVQAGFRKARGTRDQIANIRWIMEKAREFQKNIYFCFTDYAKVFDCVDHNKLENSERDGNTRPPDLPLKISVCRSRSNS